jgi:arylsulfatase
MSLVAEPPIKPGTPDPYTPPAAGDLQPETHLQIGAIIQYVTSLHHVAATHNGEIRHQHGMVAASG